MTRNPIACDGRTGPDRGPAAGRAPVAATLLVALLAQLATPAFARPGVGEGGPGVAATPDTSAHAAGPAPAQSPPLVTADARHWADLVRACTASAKHVRLRLPGRTVEVDNVQPEASGVRFVAPHLSSRPGAITAAPAGRDTLVAWNDITRVEVRNVASVGEGATRGAFVGLLVGLPVALAVGFGEALGGIFTTRHQDTHSAEIMLGAVALGAALGAAGNRHRNGGWVTCAERDTLGVIPATASLH